MSRWVSQLKWQTAVAEFAIVVLGILIALGIDQAVERRGERRLEGEYLASLLADIEQDLSALDSFYFPFIARRDTAARWLDTFAKVPTLSISDSVKFISDIYVAAAYPTFDSRRSTFEDLSSTGNLHLIEDPQLRQRIISYYHLVDNVHEIDRIRQQHAYTAGQQLAASLVPGPALPMIAGLRTGQIDSLSLRHEAANALDASRLRSGEHLSNLAALSVDWGFSQRDWYGQVREAANEVKAAIEGRLGL
jgi:hypothetical protein